MYIKADTRAKYEAVEDVVDNLRAAGVDQIGSDHGADSEQDDPAAAGGKPATRRSSSLGSEFKENLLWQ